MYYISTFLYLALLFTFDYTVMIKIYVTIYLEREKRLKSLVLLVLWVKWVVSPPLWYTLVSWVWGLHYHLVMTPLVELWSFIFYLVLAHLLCVVPWPPLVWWLNLITLFCYCYVTIWPLVPYSKCTQIYFMFYYGNHTKT